MSNGDSESDLPRDRQASMLTPTYRRILDPEHPDELDPQTSRGRSTRKRIRERVRAGVHDFRLLFEGMDKTERDEIFGIQEGSWEEGRMEYDEEILESVKDLFGFFFLCYYYPDIPMPYSEYEFLIEEGIKRAIARERSDVEVWTVRVPVDVVLKETSSAEALRKYEAGEPMDFNEVLRLLQEQDVPSELVVHPPSESTGTESDAVDPEDG